MSQWAYISLISQYVSNVYICPEYLYMSLVVSLSQTFIYLFDAHIAVGDIYTHNIHIYTLATWQNIRDIYTPWRHIYTLSTSRHITDIYKY